MSNVTVVTPYEEKSNTKSIVEQVGDCVSTVAEWLAEETPEEKQAVENLKSARRRERLGTTEKKAFAIPTPPTMKTVPLHLQDTKSLISSAKKLGYKVTSSPPSLPRLGKTNKPLPKQPRLLLENKKGERLAVVEGDKNRLTVLTTNNLKPIHSLVRQHTIDQAQKHLTRQGMEVTTRSTQSGDLELVAKEKPTKHSGGNAKITARVCEDGRVRLDVDQVRGRRCEKISTQFSKAVGGQVTAEKKKDSYFVLPQNSVQKNIKV